MVISAKNTFLCMTILCISILVLHIFASYFLFYDENLTGDMRSFYARFHMDNDMTIHKWFSQVILFMAALLIIVVSSLKLETKWRYYWRLLAVIFVLISFDEGTSFHSMTVAPTRELFGITGGYLYFAWIIPVLALLVLLCVLYVNFFLHLPKKTKILFAASLLIFVGGAAVMEMLSANYVAELQEGVIQKDYMVNIWIAAEEFMEIFGVTVFVYALLDYIRYSESKSGKKLGVKVI